MYSNNSEIVRDALCFFMDEEKGHEIAYVQFPQNYSNLTRNDLYGTDMRVIETVSNIKNNYTFITVWPRGEYILMNCISFLECLMKQVEFPNMDACGGPCYVGSGCFHRRETLCGMKYSKECERGWKREYDRENRESASVLEESCKVLASCTYEENTQWGKEVALSECHACMFFFPFFLFLNVRFSIYMLICRWD